MGTSASAGWMAQRTRRANMTPRLRDMNLNILVFHKDGNNPFWPFAGIYGCPAQYEM